MITDMSSHFTRPQIKSFAQAGPKVSKNKVLQVNYNYRIVETTVNLSFALIKIFKDIQEKKGGNYLVIGIINPHSPA